MFVVLLQALLLATAGFFAVGSLTIVLLLLLSSQGWRNGLAYALGYLTGYLLWGWAVVGLGYRVQAGGTEASHAAWGWFFVVLGGLLVGIGWRQSRRPPAPQTGPPRFLRALDQITPLRAFGLGLLVTVLNFKNLGLYLSAISVILLSPLPLATQLALVPPVALTFCLSVLAPIGLYLLAPQRATRLVHGLRHALERHGHTLSIWAPIGFGLLLMLYGWRLLT